MTKTKSKKGATSSHTIAAKGGCLQHNRRTQLSQNVYPERTKLNTSWESDTIKNRKQLRGLKERAEKLYTEKTGQKCQKSFAPYKESCVVINDSSTLEEAKAFALMVEEGIPGIECLGIWIHKDEGHYKSKYTEGDRDFQCNVHAHFLWYCQNPNTGKAGIECLGIWIHKDEGHYKSKYTEGDRDFQCNVHAHFLWYCQNPNTGKAIPIKRQDMRNMQDWAAKAFGMERGTPVTETKAKHMQMTDYKLQAMEKQLDDMQAALDSLSTSKEAKEATIEAIRAAKNAFLSLFDESVAKKEIKAQRAVIDDYKRTILGLLDDNKQLKQQLTEAQQSAKSASRLYMSMSGEVNELHKKLHKERVLRERRVVEAVSNALNIPLEQAQLLVDHGEQLKPNGGMKR